MSAGHTWEAFDDELEKLGDFSSITKKLFAKKPTAINQAFSSSLNPSQRAAVAMHIIPGYLPNHGVKPDPDLFIKLKNEGVRAPGLYEDSTLAREMAEWMKPTNVAKRYAAKAGERLGLVTPELPSSAVAPLPIKPQKPQSQVQGWSRWDEIDNAAGTPPPIDKMSSVMGALTHPATVGAGLGAGGVALMNEAESLWDPREQQKSRGERAQELGLGAGIGAVTNPLLMHMMKRGFDEEMAKVSSVNAAKIGLGLGGMGIGLGAALNAAYISSLGIDGDSLNMMGDDIALRASSVEDKIDQIRAAKALISETQAANPLGDHYASDQVLRDLKDLVPDLRKKGIGLNFAAAHARRGGQAADVRANSFLSPIDLIKRDEAF
jgi:hypothetical protein